MAHIHTEPGQYDFTASAFIVRLDGPEPRLLLHRHRLLNKYLQFGGHVELHENPWQAVIHEIAEESGYALSQLKLLQPPVRLSRISGAIAHPYPVSLATHRFGDKDHFHTDIAYGFVTYEDPANEVGDDESSDMRSFTAGQLAAPQSTDVLNDIKDIGLFIFEECLHNWHAVDPTDYQ